MKLQNIMFSSVITDQFIKHHKLKIFSTKTQFINAIPSYYNWLNASEIMINRLKMSINK